MKFTTDFNAVRNLQNVANHYLLALLTMLSNNIVSDDGYICLMQYKKGMYSIFPEISHVRNKGHDRSGAGCGYMENDIYSTQNIHCASSSNFYSPYDLEPNCLVNQSLYVFIRISFYSKIKLLFKLLIINISNRKK